MSPTSMFTKRVPFSTSEIILLKRSSSTVISVVGDLKSEWYSKKSPPTTSCIHHYFSLRGIWLYTNEAYVTLLPEAMHWTGINVIISVTVIFCVSGGGDVLFYMMLIQKVMVNQRMLWFPIDRRWRVLYILHSTSISSSIPSSASSFHLWHHPY